MAITEQDNSRQITFTATGITAKRIFRCGFLTYQADLTSAGLTIGAIFPGLSSCYLRTIGLDPFGKTTASGGRQYYLVNCDYSTSEVAQRQEAGHLEESIEFGGEMLTRGRGMWKNCQQDAPSEQVGGTFYPRVEIPAVITLKHTEFKRRIGTIVKSSGKVNSGSFTVNSIRCEGKERWLFNGGSARSFTGAEGEKRWTLTLKFIGRPAPGPTWQEIWHEEHSGGAQYEEVLFRPRGAGEGANHTEKRYGTCDFNQFLR